MHVADTNKNSCICAIVVHTKCNDRSACWMILYTVYKWYVHHLSDEHDITILSIERMSTILTQIDRKDNEPKVN